MKRRAFVVLILLVLLLVWPLHRFAHADASVAFLGDSITQKWQYPVANFGIYGQTTAEMLRREPAILDRHAYRTVVILGGTNDILLHVSDAETLRNLEAMASMASTHGLQPVLCEVPPIFHSFDLANKENYLPRVIRLNREIVGLAAQHGWLLVDYYTPLAGHPSLLSDGVHMKRSAYLLMEVALLRHVR
jgi:lysophospholipase L1-like esterase